MKIMDEKNPVPQQRWDPFLKEWVIFAPHRGSRPILDHSFTKEEKKPWTCPFCPDAPEGSGEWIVKLLPNRFSSLNEEAPLFSPHFVGDYFKETSNYGKCEVILYSQDHNKSFAQLSQNNIVELIKLWMERYNVFIDYPEIKYPFIMENRGKEIGVSMAHPHGQIYAFAYLPPKIEREFNAVKEIYHTQHKCLLCEIVKTEQHEQTRIVDESDSFIAFIPYYAHWPFEIHVVSKHHISAINECQPKEIEDLASMMKRIVQRYDALRDDGQIMPYVMAIHNAPVKVEERTLWHFHIEFYTPFRGAGRWKFLAGVELGCNTFINDSLPEINAKIFRELQIPNESP
jgi:UDPglucose--hexose-1-phosphate uridylyltransferase